MVVRPAKPLIAGSVGRSAPALLLSLLPTLAMTTSSIKTVSPVHAHWPPSFDLLISDTLDLHRSPSPPIRLSPATPPLTQVLVTGANGYLASHICRELLSRGYEVRACVRDKDNPSSVEHLRLLESTGSSLKLFSTGDMADDTLEEDTSR